ncbi:MAG: VCBS repeat-containing protein [Bryobacterales bacterium]|nr:VCBS repeat-containing protein [Bryobacterales bacterium]
MLATAERRLQGEIGWRAQPLPAPANTAGAALDGDAILAWGEGLWRVSLTGRRPERLSTSRFRAAGCLYDINHDGRRDLVLNRADGVLVWLPGPVFQREAVIDRGVSITDCLGSNLLGRRGILVTYRGLQVRFYEISETAGGERWPYTEIYSFYTPSYQSGLLEHDVDGDGLPDLLSGNYWIRSPKEFTLPWRLFAIDTYNEQPDSAHMRLALIRLATGVRALLASQGELTEGKLAVFTPNTDPKVPWKETRMEDGLSLHYASALAVADMDGDGREDFILGERAGEGRLWWFKQKPDGRFERRLIRSGHAVHTVMAHEGREGRDVIAVGSREAMVYRNESIQ